MPDLPSGIRPSEKLNKSQENNLCVAQTLQFGAGRASVGRGRGYRAMNQENAKRLSNRYAEMGIRICWCNSDTDNRALGLGDSCREIRPVKSSSTSGLAKFKWKALWMKFKKEMKKMFECVSPLQVPYYNPYTYSQNFDQGFAWEEPDNLSRSFSVRFADSSSNLLKKTEM